MHLISLRKNFLLITLLVSLFSLCLQTQAFACCWPWCCCYSGERERNSTPVKPRDTDRLINSEETGAYGATSTLPPPQSFLPQDHTTSSLPLTGQRQSPLVPTMLPQETSLSSPAPSLVVHSRSGPPPIPGWYDDDPTFPRHEALQVWTGKNTVFGVEQQMPPTFDRDVEYKFSTSTGWKDYPDERALDRFFGKVIHYALDDVQNNIALFLNGIKQQWKLAPPKTFSFSYFSGSRYYYFFAKTDSQVIYMRMQLIMGQNDETTRSQPSTRNPSRMTSRQSSPQKERVASSSTKRTQDDDSD
ncbi:MAG: hypothetical protein HYX35_01060 [Proteobacteria bacterium]|nr:hypothetical protein [Pseudomonadota bacterium]